MWPPIHALTSRVDLMAFSIIIIHNVLIRPAPLDIDCGAGVRQWGWTKGWILLAMGMDQGMDIAASWVGIGRDELAGYGNGSAMQICSWVGI